jgi:hypothetical protein
MNALLPIRGGCAGQVLTQDQADGRSLAGHWDRSPLVEKAQPVLEHSYSGSLGKVC